MTIANTKLKAFLPHVMPFVDGCPRPVAELQLRNAAIEFCERTRAWRHMMAVTLTAQNQSVSSPNYTAIHEIEDATFDGVALTPTQFTDVGPTELTGQESLGFPRYVTQIAPSMLSVYPFATGTLRMSVFLKPRSGQAFGTDPDDPLHDAYNMVPEFMLSQHADTIAAGALSRIMALPKQRFTNEAMAGFYMSKFMEHCDRKSDTSMRGQQRAPKRTTSRYM